MLERVTGGPGGHAGGVLAAAVGGRRAGRVRRRRRLEQHGARGNRGLAVHQGSVAARRRRLLVQREATSAGAVHRSEQVRVLARAHGMGR